MSDFFKLGRFHVSDETLLKAGEVIGISYLPRKYRRLEEILDSVVLPGESQNQESELHYDIGNFKITVRKKENEWWLVNIEAK